MRVSSHEYQRSLVLPVLHLMLWWTFPYMSSVLLLPLSCSPKLTSALKPTEGFLANFLRALPCVLILFLFKFNFTFCYVCAS